MTMHEPDWTRLPADPAGFFALGASFDRQELRRSYAQWIRRYKPETHPEEFQKIRAAYEALDAQLRYGAARSAEALAVSTAGAWESAAAQALVGKTPAAARLGAAGRPAPPSPARRLAEEPPGTVYLELAKAPGKSPHDFYLLALLADVVRPGDRHGFLNWVLRGLQEHAGEPALGRLLKEYLRSDAATADLPQVLVDVSQVVTGDGFYFLTEAAWDRLLREAEFSLFRRTLAACEANLHDYRIAARLAFYTHLLRAALWKADELWLDEAFAAVERHAGEMDPALENDWELTLHLREYRKHAERFARASQIGRRMDQAIRTWCTQPPLEAALTLAECQDEIAHDAHGVMEAFPVEGADDWSQVAVLWQMIAAAVAEEFGFDAPPQQAERLRRLTLGALRDLREEIQPLVARYMRLQRIVLVAWLAALVVGPLILLAGVVPLKYSWPLMLCWPAAAGALHVFLLRPRYLEPWLDRQLHRQFRTLYQAAWRPRMFRHLHAAALPAQVMLALLMQVGRELGDDNWLGWLLGFLQRDTGFPVYAAAQPFAR